jgi:hypothetical protein
MLHITARDMKDPSLARLRNPSARAPSTPAPQLPRSANSIDIGGDACADRADTSAQRAVPAASLRTALPKLAMGAQHPNQLVFYRATTYRVIARLVSLSPLLQRKDDDGRPTKLIRRDIGQERLPILG